MKIIDSKISYTKYRDLVYQIFNEGVGLPKQVFKNKHDFVFLAFDSFHSRKFYETLSRVFNGKFVFFTVNPNPEEYMKDYKKYSVIEFDNSDQYELFIQKLHESRGSKYVDSIIDLVHELVICSLDSSFSAYAIRDLNIMLLGFDKLSAKKSFLMHYGIENTYMTEEVVDELMCNVDVDRNFEFVLSQNYSNYPVNPKI